MAHEILPIPPASPGEVGIMGVRHVLIVATKNSFLPHPWYYFHAYVNTYLSEYLRQLPLTLGERVIVEAACVGNGVFADKCDVVSSVGNRDGVILSDGRFLYVLGNVSALVVPDTESYSAVLGTSSAVGQLKGIKVADSSVIKKDFAFLEDAGRTMPVIVPANVEIGLISDQTHLDHLSFLEAQFLGEELATDSQKFYKKKERIPRTHPVILKRNGEAIGMVKSDFFSERSAMVSMLFIATEHRGRGYGQLLLQWYIHFLLERSGSICLFYSKTNAAAKELYRKVGFQKNEEWTMML